MKPEQKLFYKIIHPSIPVTILTIFFTLICFSTATITYLWGFHMAVYLTFFSIATLLFFYSVYGVVRSYQKIKNAIYQWMMKFKFTRNMIESFSFNFVLKTFVSFFINIAFVFYNMVLSLINLSLWHGLATGYYLILSVLRLILIYGEISTSFKNANNETKTNIKKLKIYRNCGFVLLLLELALIPLITVLIRGGKPGVYTLSNVIIIAIYTFYKIIAAIVNVIRAIKSSDRIMRAFRNINLCDALFSLLSLEVSMLELFLGVSDEFTIRMSSISGFVVIAITAIIALYMQIKASADIRKLKNADSSN